MRSERPTGTVTFVFTDIEGSTALLDRLGDAYGDVLFTHHALLRAIWTEHDGVEISTEGDAFFVAFGSASAAIVAAIAAQAALGRQTWPQEETVRVRIGLHTGEPRIRDGDYWGPDVHYAARVASAARGGQILVSAATAALASGHTLVSLGRHRLKDFPQPRELFAVGAGPHPQPKTLDPLRTNLPSAPTALVGRDREIEEIASLLLGDARVVSVIGGGGTGKTRLALAVADRLVDEFDDGAFLVNLSELTSPEEVAGAIASVVGTSADFLSATLAERELLLVLDNFEHLLDAAPVVGDLVGTAPGVRILITSQAPLRLMEEHTYALGGLEDEAAVALLRARAHQISRDEGTGAPGAEAIRALCHQLEGSPLAIELAAARLALLSPTELLERLRRSPDALGKGGRNLPERQRGLRAAMQWSYGLLDAQSATLFRRIGHFSGSTTLERIEQVCGEEIDDVLESLATLVDLSMVRRTRSGRFEPPSALRAFSRELLDASGERDSLNRRHAEAAVAGWLPAVFDRPMTAYRESYDAILAEQPDVTALLDWSGVADIELFGRLAICTWAALAQAGVGGVRMERWAEPIGRAAASEAFSGRLRAQVCFANAAAIYGRDRSVRLLEVVLEADTAGYPTYTGWLRGTAAVMDSLLEPGSEWRPLAESVLSDLSSSADPELRDLGAVLSAHLCLLDERFDEAADGFEAAIARGGGTWVAETPVYMVGDCHLLAGRPQAALAPYARGVRDALDRGSRLNMAFQGEGIAAALADLGRHEEAIEALGASDCLTGTGVLPRDFNPGWSEVVDGRIERSRAALGPSAAESAYARGHGLGAEGAVPLLLAYGAPVDVGNALA